MAKKIAIKEFFPKDFCGRDNTSHLTLGTRNNAETVAKLKDRFLKEARNIAKLDHPGIVKIHDVFEENDTAYYVMDYIDGENLNEIVKRNGPLPEAKAVEYIRKVGDALDYIHSRNMIHFDVKPANIVVRKADDFPILLDFGLSKQYDSQGGATSTLMQGVSNGYSPIELYNAGALNNFSPQTDVYFLGATLYYLITGKTPATASELCCGMETLNIDYTHSPSIREAITTAMSINRAQRPASVHRFVNKIDNRNLSDTNISNNSSSKNSGTNSDETIFVTPEPDNINNSGNSDDPPSPPDTGTSGQTESSGNNISFRFLVWLLIIIVGIIICVSTCETNTYKDSNSANASSEDTPDGVLISTAPNGYNNGHGWVDLGLPSGNKWAYANIQLDSVNIDENGHYLEESFNYGTYFNHQWTEDTTLFNGWLLPTKEDYEELFNFCDKRYIDTGVVIYGKNGTALFLPFAGCNVNNEWKDQDVSGYYLIEGNSYFNFWPNGATKTNRDSDLKNRFYPVRMILK